MSLTIRLNGQDYGDFKSARAVKNIETVCGAFSFTSSASSTNLFPIKKGDEVEILSDGLKFLTGFVEKVSGGYDSESHSISVSGRDKLADLVDSTVLVDSMEFTGAISLKSVCEKILDSLGIKVKVIDQVGNIKDFGEDEITSAEVGQKAFEFLETFARKRQVLLSSDADSNLLLLRASSDKLPIKLQHVVGGNDNNIKGATFAFDDTERYNRYIVSSELNPILLSEGSTPQDISEQEGEAFDKAIRATRILQINAEEASDSFTAVDRAKWQANIRRSRAFDYSCVVQGHSILNGDVRTAWAINKLIPITDDFADIDGEFRTRQIEMAYSIDDGSVTTVGFTRKDAYTLQAEESQRQAATSESGGKF